jgi:hypothetical protein
MRDFSLVLGGPIYQYFLRVGLLKPPLDRAKGRILVLTLVAWAPLLMLTALSGSLTGGVKIPFLSDFEAHLRFLAVLPLLIAAEVTINRRIRTMLHEFVNRQVITQAVFPKFERVAESALRLRNSVVIELGLVALVYIAGTFWSRTVLSVQSDTWFAVAAPGGKVLTPAGYWYQFVSLPLVQFIALRWYFRLFLWGRLLWQISRLDLNLVPTHPDRCCGLGFLGEVAFALTPFLVAHGILLAGFLANRILYEGIPLPGHKVEIASMAIFVYLLALGPVCVFTPRLLVRRREGLSMYGALASEYVIGFQKKWIEGQRPGDEPLVGTADIQSLADLGNSFEVVQGIRPFSFGRPALVTVAVCIVLPISPLIFTMFSFQELVQRLLQIVL